MTGITVVIMTTEVTMAMAATEGRMRIVMATDVAVDGVLTTAAQTIIKHLKYVRL